MIGILVVLVLYAVLAGAAVFYWRRARHEFAKAAAHKSAGELAYARANHAAAYQRHARYTTASSHPGIGLTAIMCCGCSAVVGVVESDDEVQALAEAHVREEAWKLRQHIEQVTK